LLVAVGEVRSSGAALLCGAVAAAAAYLPSFAWVASVAVPGWLALATYVGLYLAGLAVIVHRLRRRFPACWPLLAAFVWVALDLTRARLGPGFPWLFLGYTQYRFRALAQLAAVTGVYGVSFLVFFLNASLAGALLSLWRHAGTRQAYASCLMLGVAAMATGGCAWAGAVVLRTTPVEDGPAVGVVQQNVPRLVSEIYGRPKSAAEIYQERADEVLLSAQLTAQLAGKGARLVAWPESTVPVPLDPGVVSPFAAERELREQTMNYLRGLGAQLGCYFLVGAPSYEPSSIPSADSLLYGVTATPEFRNSAVLLSPGGEFLGRYDKIRLVPFGEYIPLRRIFPFLQRLTPIPRELTPGRRKAVFELPAGRDGKALRFAVLICYEDVFPELTRDFRRRGAEVLFNLTDEGWYRIPGELGQHLAMAAFRAIETRTTVVRAANTGISCFIGPTGRVYAELKPLTRDSGSAQVRICNSLTPYVRYGDVFAVSCLMLAMVLPALLTTLSGAGRNAS